MTSGSLTRVEPVSPALGGWSLSHRTAREVPRRGSLYWLECPKHLGQGLAFSRCLRTISCIIWVGVCARAVALVASASFVTAWTVATRLLSPWGFSRQEYWSGLPCSLPGDLPDPGIEEPVSLMSPALAGVFFIPSTNCEAYTHTHTHTHTYYIHTHTYVFSFYSPLLTPLYVYILKLI